MIDAGDFLANIFDHGACRARSRQIAANDLDDAGNPGQGIANLVGQASGHLSQGGKVLGARHLRAVQALDLDPALAELRNHLVEVASQVSDFVVAVGKAHVRAEVTAAELSNLLLQFDHRPLHGISEDHEEHAANRNRARTCDQQHHVAFGIAPGECRQQEQQHSVRAEHTAIGTSALISQLMRSQGSSGSFCSVTRRRIIHYGSRRDWIGQHAFTRMRSTEETGARSLEAVLSRFRRHVRIFLVRHNFRHTRGVQATGTSHRRT